MRHLASQAGVRYAGPGEIERMLSAERDRVLGCIGHGEPEGIACARSDIPFAWTGLQPLEAAPRYEVWLSPTPVARNTWHGIRVASSAEVLFGCADFEVGNSETFRDELFAQYCGLFDVLDAAGYPHLLRMWHYLPQIHLEDHGLERYKLFSAARHDAFVAKGRTISRDAPAASAVGKPAGNAVIAFLAALRPGTPITNPRQVNAYQYPSQYGPRSPTFCRALRTAWGGFDQLYISGTASIVGHESRHAGDAARQADETILNLRALFAEVDAGAALPASAWTSVLFKVYLRDRAARDQVVPRLRRAFGERPPLLLLEGDICRRELLLEVEAVALHAESSAK
jgi:chorismate lyase/3-hydroxybenzoate synthase